MPTPDSIVSGLTAIANEWRTLAIGWHLVFGALLLAVGAGWRPSHRHAGYLLAAPLLSVAGLAWIAEGLHRTLIGSSRPADASGIH